VNDIIAVDKRQVRRSFEHAAATYDAAAALQNEVRTRMLGRLDYIKLAPRIILDAGCGTGNAVEGLLSRFSGSRVIAFDLALAMARRAHARRPWWRSVLEAGRPRLAALCGDLERLPLASGSVDLAWSSLAVQWLGDPKRAFAEMHRVLAPGGLLLFSSVGPDTLKELRAAFAGVDGNVHVQTFLDMHDVGDRLLASGFADPVMDMEVITLTYADVKSLMRDLKALGTRNAMPGRADGLSGKERFAHMARNYEIFRRDGRLPATFEVVYGHAWKPAARMSPTGHPVIDIKPRSGT